MSHRAQSFLPFLTFLPDRGDPSSQAETKRPSHTKNIILWQLGHLPFADKIRRFPSPSIEGFSFVGIVYLCLTVAVKSRPVNFKFP
jgi:hypothetical protein